MGATPRPQGKAMYVANPLDKSWLLSEQRKLHKRSLKTPDYIFCKLWGLATDSRNLRTAFERVARNKGRRTAGVDGLTVKAVLRKGVEAFIEQVRGEMCSGKYRPSPVRRVLIPKPGQPGKFRPASTLLTIFEQKLLVLSPACSAQGGTRTRTPCGATPSRWCVYQFHHLGLLSYC